MVREEALAKAHRTRAYRAALKRRIKSGEVTKSEVMELMTSPPLEVEKMRVREIISALPYFAKSRTMALLRRARIGYETRVEDLTAAARERLRLCLHHWPDPPPND